MKTLDIIRRSTPEERAYLDSILLIEDGNELWTGLGSACPNPYQPSTEKPWHDVYAMIAPGEYEAVCCNRKKHFKCLALTGRIPTINPNVNHGGEYFAEGILVHCGDTEIWRGSAGCITIPPSKWSDFIVLFSFDEAVKIILRKAGAA
jgi:hypothetical protein